MKLGEMNWPTISELDKGSVVAVFPIAPFEQHGLHLPLLTIETTGIVDRLDGPFVAVHLFSGVHCLGDAIGVHDEIVAF